MLFTLFKKLFAHRILGNYEIITVIGPKGRAEVLAKIDSGANRTSIDKVIAEKIGLTEESNVLFFKDFESGLGKQKRPVVKTTLIIRQQKIPTEVSISDRSHMKHKIIVGRRDTHDFLVQPAQKEDT